MYILYKTQSWGHTKTHIHLNRGRGGGKIHKDRGGGDRGEI